MLITPTLLEHSKIGVIQRKLSWPPAKEWIKAITMKMGFGESEAGEWEIKKLRKKTRRAILYSQNGNGKENGRFSLINKNQ